MGKPRAVIAGLGLMVLAGIGAAGAFVVDQTATSQAGVEAIMATPPARPVEATEDAPAHRLPDTTSAVSAPAPAPAPSKAAPQAPAATAAVIPRKPHRAPAADTGTAPTSQDAGKALADFEAGLSQNDPRWGRTLAPTPPELTARAARFGGPKLAFSEGQAAPAMAALSRFAGDAVTTSGIPENLAPHAIPVPSARPIDDAPQASGRSARIRSAVNLRARPADGASVLTVVPANATVGLIGCKSWCEIEFQNRRGFVYKKFVR